MTIFNQINKAILVAMKNKDTETLAALRDIKTEMSKAVSGGNKELNDVEALAVLTTLKKQRTNNITEFSNNAAYVAEQQSNLNVINQYLPAEVGDEELNRLILEAVHRVGKNMGDIIKYVKASLIGLNLSVNGKTLADKVKLHL